jgi:DNA-binding MarR family transcriptional regulator
LSKYEQFVIRTMERPSPTPTIEELTAIAELRAALRRFHRATDAIALRQGLTARRYDLLAMLHSAPGRTRTLGALARLLELSPNATTELVDRAVSAGLVTRTGGGEDARVKQIAPTPHGTGCFYAAVEELRPERRRLLAILEEIAAHSARLSES